MGEKWKGATEIAKKLKSRSVEEGRIDDFSFRIAFCVREGGLTRLLHT